LSAFDDSLFQEGHSPAKYDAGLTLATTKAGNIFRNWPLLLISAKMRDFHL
jgi:hypothetical protein